MSWILAAIFAVTSALATFGHMPMVRAANGHLATLAQIVLALPDGTLPEICETNSDGTPKHSAETSAHCDLCRLIEPPTAPLAAAPSATVVLGTIRFAAFTEATREVIAFVRPPGRAPPSAAPVRA
ncbi:hypothetical protein [Phreatobacter sp.]|uniref:hypothetical protein n=1 Tax=Phreatobacter sp. TaxID=1966341 RepID=UPI0025F543C4|nr:hypothetical protein [Phreatobacter sp.]